MVTGNDNTLQADVAAKSLDQCCFTCCKFQQHKKWSCECGERQGGYESHKNAVSMRCECWTCGKREAGSNSEGVIDISIDCKYGADLESKNATVTVGIDSSSDCVNACNFSEGSDNTAPVSVTNGDSAFSSDVVNSGSQDCRAERNGTVSECCTASNDEKQLNCCLVEDSSSTSKSCKLDNCDTEPHDHCCTVMSTVPKSSMVGAGPIASCCVEKEPILCDGMAVEGRRSGEKSVLIAKHTKRVHWEDEREEDEGETQEEKKVCLHIIYSSNCIPC